MNQKQARLVVGAVALVFGGGAILGMKSIISKPVQVVKIKNTGTVDVLVASSNIGLGDTVKASHFNWIAWPKDGVSAHYIQRRKSPKARQKLAKSIARLPMIAGEPITRQKLIKPGQGGVLASILGKGKRAISTKISEQSAAGRLILPNDHVDVLVGKRPGKNSAYNVTVLFENIRVLAIGQLIEAKNKKSASAKTATLELTPAQAKKLVLEQSTGKISLSLRSIADFGKPKKIAKVEKPNKRKMTKVLRYGITSYVRSVN